MKAPTKKAPGPVLAPMSETAAQLLRQLMQDAADAAAAPGSLVLQPLAQMQADDNGDPLRCIACSKDFSSSVAIRRYIGTPQPEWYGHEERLDAEGRRWSRPLFAVMDDFGALVEVRP